MKKFGLIGKRIDYSFSKKYFTKKFQQENIDAIYQNYEIESLDALKEIIEKRNISGLNVTIPYKQQIIPLLDELSALAKTTNAVNCIKISHQGKWVGHNTDVIGFEKSLLNFIKKERPQALIFGTGGASKAVQFVLEKLNISFRVVSRSDIKQHFSYNDVNTETLNTHKLLINTTPLGTFPKINECIDIPYQAITANHFCFDLIYNPSETQFLNRCKKHGAQIKNGLEMLEIQAEESYVFWTED